MCAARCTEHRRHRGELQLQATQDTANDDGESVELSFGTLPDRVSAGSTDRATVSITDDDDPPQPPPPPQVSVSFEQGAYTVAEGGSVTVKVTLSADPERSVTVPISTSHLGGASGSDYSGVPSSVSFAAGETEQSFSFMAAQDAANDDGESVRLSFGTPPAGVSAGSNDETVISITDDDVPDTAESSSVSATGPTPPSPADPAGRPAHVTSRVAGLPVWIWIALVGLVTLLGIALLIAV